MVKLEWHVYLEVSCVVSQVNTNRDCLFVRPEERTSLGQLGEKFANFRNLFLCCTMLFDHKLPLPTLNMSQLNAQLCLRC